MFVRLYVRCVGLQATALTEAATLHGIALEKQKKSTEETVSALTDTISSMKDNIEVMTHPINSNTTHFYHYLPTVTIAMVTTPSYRFQ